MKSQNEGNLNASRIQRFVRYRVRGAPFWIIGICGLAGVSVDFDHLFSEWITGRHTRAAHIPLAIISCIVLCCIGTYCGRLYYKLVLGKKRQKPPVSKT
jgi:hypothetical protein